MGGVATACRLVPPPPLPLNHQSCRATGGNRGSAPAHNLSGLPVMTDSSYVHGGVQGSALKWRANVSLVRCQDQAGEFTHLNESMAFPQHPFQAKASGGGGVLPPAERIRELTVACSCAIQPQHVEVAARLFSEPPQDHRPGACARCAAPTSPAPTRSASRRSGTSCASPPRTPWTCRTSSTSGSRTGARASGCCRPRRPNWIPRYHLPVLAPHRPGRTPDPCHPQDRLSPGKD